jgi:RNA polymerase sigma factor (sigma-70 family)
VSASTTNISETVEPIASRRIDRSDGDLVRACRKGDPAAWDQLVERYQRLIYAIPRRAGLSEERCADVFQEVFVTLLEKIDQIEQPEKIRSWMVTTAKFKTWSSVRAEKGFYSSETEDELEAEMAAAPDAAPLADEQIIRLEEQHLIRTAVKLLEQRCRTILSMIYLRETAASYAEVASAIGVGETSISPLRTRCLKKLEKLLTN